MEVVEVPPVPDKYDIIPIHASDVSTFLACRRRWDWSSPARNNLRKRVEIEGVNPNLWFGSGIHYALEMYYHPVLQRDPVEAFTTWFNIQWHGGLVAEEWLERTYDIKAILMPDQHEVKVDVGSMTAIEDSQPMYTIRGLRDLLPDPNQDEFMALFDLGVGMMTFYREYAPKNDDFVVISPEAKFSVPLMRPDNGRIMYAVDTREQSPNYGKKLEVHARGQRDAIVHRPTAGKYCIIDHKTAAKIDEDYFVKLDTDPQCSTYIWASQQEAQIYDLPYKNVDEVIYQALRKVYPKPPTALNNSTPSLNRTEESTTAEMFLEFIKEGALEVWYESNEKAQGYYSWLLANGDENFVVRRIAHRNKAMIANTGYHLGQIATEMLDPKLPIYPRFTGDYSCTRCMFRAPCIAEEDGSGSDYMIDNGYERNRGR